MAEGSSTLENGPILSHLLNEYEKVYWLPQQYCRLQKTPKYSLLVISKSFLHLYKRGQKIFNSLYKDKGVGYLYFLWACPKIGKSWKKHKLF